MEPAVEPVSAAELRAFLRLDEGDSDAALLSGLIRAARVEVEQATGLALITQRFRLSLDGWPPGGTAAVALHPLTAVLAATLRKADGESAALPAGSCVLDPVPRPARLHFAQQPPAALPPGHWLEVELQAGFGEAGVDVPDPLRRAVLILAAHWHEVRGPTGSEGRPGVYPAGFERLVAFYQPRRL